MKSILTLSVLTILFATICPSISFAKSEPWDKWDKALFGSFTGLMVIDYGQSRYILSHPEKYRENNYAIRKLGKDRSILYFAGCGLGAYLIADHLKPTPRKIFLGALNLIEIKATSNNASIGIKISFSF